MTSVAACTASASSASAASRASALSVVITRIASATRSGGAASRLSAVEMTPSPIGFVSTSTSPACASRLVKHACRIDGADHREPELRFGVVDGVTAADERARGAHDVATAVEHAREQLEREPFAWPRDEVEREQRRTAHRVDVGERVGRGDATPVVRVVDDRREEVGGDDDREVVAQPVDGGVVGGVEADEQIRVDRRVTRPADEPEHGAQVGGRQLARAPRAVRERGEPYVLGVGHRADATARGDQPGRTAPMTPGQIAVICTFGAACAAHGARCRRRRRCRRGRPRRRGHRAAAGSSRRSGTTPSGRRSRATWRRRPAPTPSS